MSNFKVKIHQIRFRLQFRCKLAQLGLGLWFTTPLKGAYSAPPYSLAEFKEDLLLRWGRGGKGKGEKGKGGEEKEQDRKRREREDIVK